MTSRLIRSASPDAVEDLRLDDVVEDRVERDTGAAEDVDEYREEGELPVDALAPLRGLVPQLDLRVDVEEGWEQAIRARGDHRRRPRMTARGISTTAATMAWVIDFAARM